MYIDLTYELTHTADEIANSVDLRQQLLNDTADARLQKLEGNTKITEHSWSPLHDLFYSYCMILIPFLSIQLLEMPSQRRPSKFLRRTQRKRI